MAEAAPPTPAATLERARSLTNEAMLAVVLQRRRLTTREPEDDKFVFRPWADFQFFIVALRRLRRAAAIAADQPRVQEALAAFDIALPFLSKLRNVGEHIDEYAVDDPRYRGGSPGGRVSRRELQVGEWGENAWNWLGERVDLDAAVTAAEQLHDAVVKSRLDPSGASALLR